MKGVKMMKVICKNADYIVNLTEGKEYECLNTYTQWEQFDDHMLVTVVDDVDEIMHVGKWRFEVVDMFSKKQNDILDKVTGIHYEKDDYEYMIERAFEPLEAHKEDEVVKELFEFILPDQVNHPSHYTQGKYEVIDVIEDWNLGFNLGNAVKYIGRAGHKDDIVQDLEKAKWYIEREIKRLKDM